MFNKEDYTPSLIAELTPLISMHRSEISLMPIEVPTEPDWETYDRANAAGLLHIYTTRIDGLIVGYSVFILYRHPHYVSQLIAEPDVTYVMPTARKGMVGRDLLRFAEQDLKKLGACEIRQTVKPSIRDFSPLLLRDGYKLTDIIYTKRLI